MPTTSPLATLVNAVCEHSLLEASQQDELTTTLCQRFRDADSLALELVRRRWLTPFQAERLLQGKGDELVLGPYLLLEMLGQGAMGQVFKARHLLMNRVVALKVIRKEWLQQPQAVQRFLREIRAVAQLHHPNIVIAHDAAQVGNTWLMAMEYVPGIDLSSLINESGPLPIARACEYVGQAADGLQHAHEKGLVHRDIKPGNLLLTADGKTVKILDLGLALVQTSETADRMATLTQQGAVMGTPNYIAPEQALDAHAADIRSDIYSLGCTFYHLLTGRAPHQGKTLSEILLKHQVTEPPPVESIRPDVPTAVRAVLLKMLAKKPEDRYQTPAEVVVALTTLAKKSPQRRSALAAHPASFVPDRTEPGPVAVNPHATLVERPTGHVTVPQRVPAPRPAPQPARGRPWLAVTLILLVLLAIGGFLAAPTVVRIAQERGWLSASAPTGAVPLDSFDPAKIPAELRWEGQPQELVAVLGGRERTSTNSVAFSPDGKLLAGLGPGNVVLVWDLTTQRKRAVFLGHKDVVKAVAFSPDGKTLASAGDDQTVRLWDVDGFDLQAKNVLNAHPGWVNALAFSPDGKTLATGGSDHTIRLWDVNGRKLESRGLSLMGHENPVYALAFTPDGKLLTSGSSDKSIRLWDAATGKPLGAFPGHASSVNALAFTSDGKTLASGSSDQAVFLWKRDGNNIEKDVAFRGHDQYVYALAFARGDKTLVSADSQGSVIVWDMPRGDKRFTWRLPSSIYGVTFSPDGKYVAAGNGEGLVYILRVEVRR